jgi:hypothetical protein
LVAAEVDHRIAEFAERIAVQENKVAELERRVAISGREVRDAASWQRRGTEKRLGLDLRPGRFHSRGSL